MKALYILFQLSLTAVICWNTYHNSTSWNCIFAGSAVTFDLILLPRWLRN